jgi:LPXTG-motif cell wall-anchored protein
MQVNWITVVGLVVIIAGILFLVIRRRRKA